MRRAVVRISRELVELALTTGQDPRQLFTTVDGLPAGARLVAVGLVASASAIEPTAFLELEFEHEAFPESSVPLVVTPSTKTLELKTGNGNGEAGEPKQLIGLMENPNGDRFVRGPIADREVTEGFILELQWRLAAYYITQRNERARLVLPSGNRVPGIGRLVQ